MIKALIFDIDNTLYDYDAAHAAAFRRVTEYAGEAFGIGPGEFSALHREGDRILRGRIGTETAAIHNRLLRYQIMMEKIGRPVSHALRMSSLYWSVFLSAVTPAPGLTECFAYLKSHGYITGVGTNMTAGYQYAKLERLGLLDDMDFIVSSEEAGVEKPDRKLFRCCVEKARCPAAACAFVGDSLENDALGAQNAGLVPIWLCPEPSNSAAGLLRISSLAELPALIELL